MPNAKRNITTSKRNILTANRLLTTFKKMASYNTGFASGGVTCKLGALCYYSSSVLVDSFVLRNPSERKARKRQTVKKPPQS